MALSERSPGEDAHFKHLDMHLAQNTAVDSSFAVDITSRPRGKADNVFCLHQSHELHHAHLRPAQY